MIRHKADWYGFKVFPLCGRRSKEFKITNKWDKVECKHCLKLRLRRD